MWKSQAVTASLMQKSTPLSVDKEWKCADMEVLYTDAYSSFTHNCKTHTTLETDTNNTEDHAQIAYIGIGNSLSPATNAKMLQEEAYAF